MSSTVTTATAAVTSLNLASLSSVTAIGLAAVLLLLVFLFEKEVLTSTSRPELVAVGRYLNVVIVPLIVAFGLIATFRVGLAVGLLH